MLGQLRQKELLSKLQDVLTPTKTHGFDILSLVPHQKDGGVFVKFKYFEAGDPQQALLDIEKDLRDGVRQRGGIPSWIQMSLGNVWLVKGKPWREVNPFTASTTERKLSKLHRISTDLLLHSLKYHSKGLMSRKNHFMTY